jgi:hypothetical protein
VLAFLHQIFLLLCAINTEQFFLTVIGQKAQLLPEATQGTAGRLHWLGKMPAFLFAEG